MANKRFLRYGLRSFLVVIIAIGVWLGWYIGRVEKQKAAVRWVEENDGLVTYDYEGDPSFLGRTFGDDYVSNVYEVILRDIETVEPLRSLTHIEVLVISGTLTVDLSPLSSFPHLGQLVIWCPFQEFQVVDSLKNLRYLEIQFATIEHVDVLCGLTQLEVLHIRGILTEKSKQKIREALPNTEVQIWEDL